MANIKQQMKTNLQNEKRRVANASFKSGLKSAVKVVEESVEKNDKETATIALTLANKKLDKSVSKGFNNKNHVARQKSRLSKLVNTLK